VWLTHDQGISLIIDQAIAEIAGGKFANGAETFAFQQMFTEAARYYEEAVGRKANQFPRESRKPNKYEIDKPTGRQLPDSWGQMSLGSMTPEGFFLSSTVQELPIF